MFDKMKQLMEMQKKMQEMKRQLEAATFDVQSVDGLIRITMTGSQQVTEVGIQGDLANTQKANLEKSIKDAYNKAIKRSQEIAAEKMKDITGFNIPGLT